MPTVSRCLAPAVLPYRQTRLSWRSDGRRAVKEGGKHYRLRWVRRTALILACCALAASSLQSKDEASAKVITVLLAGLKLRVPETYVFPQGGEITEFGPVRMQGISIAFWMPDLAAPERNMFFTTTYRPSETRRPFPRGDEHLVIVRSMGPTDVRKRRGQPPPAVGIENLRTAVESSDLVEDRGLTRIVPTGRYPLPKATWFSLSEPATPFILTCFLEGEAPNPGCLVDLQFVDLDLTATLSIPTDARYGTARVAAGLRTLLDRWSEAK